MKPSTACIRIQCEYVFNSLWCGVVRTYDPAKTHWYPSNGSLIVESLALHPPRTARLSFVRASRAVVWFDAFRRFRVCMRAYVFRLTLAGALLSSRHFETLREGNMRSIVQRFS